MNPLKSLFFVLFCTMLTSIQAQVFFIDSETASYIDAAAYSPSNGSILFFSGNAVMIYDIAADKLVEPAWYELDGIEPVSAALSWGDNEILLFHGSNYSTFDVSTAEITSRDNEWYGLPESWENHIDAVVRWSEDELMFFNNTEYVIYSFSEEDYVDYDVFTTWEGYPLLWETNLEAVFNIQGEIYFLNDGDASMFSMEEGIFYAPAPIGFDEPAGKQ